MPILCLGLSHTSAPIHLRERLALTAPERQSALERFAAGDSPLRQLGLAELIILSTCNRIELYAVASPEAGEPGALLAALREHLLEARGVPAAALAPHIYSHTDMAVAVHACRVSAGLDSMIVGEPQILGQVAEAYEMARDIGAAGPVLSALFRAAVRAGKRARTETAIGRNAASVASVAVRLAGQAVDQLATSHVLVIGAGDMSELVTGALRARGACRITVANRTRQRAADLAARWGAQAVSLAELPVVLPSADIVIASTGAPHLVLEAGIVRRAMAHRARPLVIVDIAMPRNVDPAAADIPNVHLFDLDRLRLHLAGGLADRRSEIPRVEAIVAQETAAFESWLRGAAVLPVIAGLREKAERIRQRELTRALRRLPGLDPHVRRQIEQFSESLTNKLLHEPTLRLRSEAGLEHAATVRHLFGLAAGPGREKE